MSDKLQLVVREISETNFEATSLVLSVTAMPVAFTWSKTSRPRAIGARSSSL